MGASPSAGRLSQSFRAIDNRPVSCPVQPSVVSLSEGDEKMSCADKVGHSMTTTPTPLGLLAREAKRLIDESLCRPADNSGSIGSLASAAGNVLADCQNMDPEYVWGDEGPVNR
jgi:hypothetical protein